MLYTHFANHPVSNKENWVSSADEDFGLGNVDKLVYLH